MELRQNYQISASKSYAAVTIDLTAYCKLEIVRQMLIAIEKQKRTVTVLPRRTREQQSPFLYKSEQGMESKTFEQLFSDFDEKAFITEK